MNLQNYYNIINNIFDEFISPFDIDDGSEMKYNEYNVKDDHSDN